MSKTKTETFSSYSSYWLDDSMGVFDDVDKVEMDRNSIERLAKLAAVRRAVSNFVRILTNDSTIDVRYSSGKDSYTDGKIVVIAADDNVKNFDSMVGLALHEGSHCLLSDFNFLTTVNNPSIAYGAFHPELREMLVLTDNYEENSKIIVTLNSYLKLLMNIIEDRRIDSYVYTMAPGYRPYYDAMYARYFYNKDVENNLNNNPAWRIPTVENYVNWLVSMVSPSFTTTALPGLDKMVDLIDLKNIRRFDSNPHNSHFEWNAVSETTSPLTVFKDKIYIYKFDEFPLLWKVANELMIMILKYSKLQAQDNMVQMGEGSSVEVMFDMNDMHAQEMKSDLENLDMPQGGRFNETKAKKALDKMKDVIDNKIKKKKLTRTEERQISTMESASAELKENSDAVVGKVPCLVTRKLTRDIMMSKWFPFSYVDYYQQKKLTENRDAQIGVNNGIRMGQILAHRLQVRNDPQVTHFTRQNSGKVDRRILAQLGMDIEQVFKRTTVESYNPVLLHLSLDASGSMSGGKWRQVIAVATALAYAADKIRNLDVVVSIRGNTTDGIPMVAIVYDSRKDNFTKVKTLFPFLHTSGSTPEGLCFASTMDLMTECTGTHRVFFINFSDGEPGCSYKHKGEYINYAGDIALKQTKNVVREMREAGIRIMSYFITEYANNPYSTSRKMFTGMYGADAEFVDVKNVTQVLKTLNKLLLVNE